MRRYLRTPKGLLTAVLVGLSVLGGFRSGWGLVGPELGAAVLAAALIDAPILRWRKGKWELPDGAILTGLIVAMILSPITPWWVSAVTAGIGVVSKYLVRSHKANVFNPAALALVVTFYMYGTGQSWWGALPELPIGAIVVLIASGTYVAERMKKLPSVLAFLGVYYLLVTAVAFIGDPRNVAELYRTPDLQAALYFAVFMVTDPPTSPTKARDQVVYATIAAVVGFAFYEMMGVVYYLLAGILVANVWEAVRRVRATARRAKDPPRTKLSPIPH